MSKHSNNSLKNNAYDGYYNDIKNNHITLRVSDSTLAKIKSFSINPDDSLSSAFRNMVDSLNDNYVSELVKSSLSNERTNAVIAETLYSIRDDILSHIDGALVRTNATVEYLHLMRDRFSGNIESST